MKKFLKIVGVLFLGAIGIGLIWYFQSLKVEGDPLLTTCWGVEVYDDLTGEKVVGVEDLDFDPESGTIFMSAYDRRAVAREIDEGKVTTQGGIYTINVSDITVTASLKVTDISRAFKDAGNEFRPHGFDVWGINSNKRIFAINRLYKTERSDAKMTPVIEVFEYNQGQLLHSERISFSNVGTVQETIVCDLYDVTYDGDSFVTFLIVTHFPRFCEKFENGEEGDFRPHFKALNSDFMISMISHDSMPNGIARFYSQDLNIFTFTITLEKQILISVDKPEKKYVYDVFDLSIFPDNVTIDHEGTLLVAGFPNLIDYYFYMKSWLGVEKSPSVVYRISPETYEQTLLFKDNGAMISGATVALRAGDYLIMGSAWDDNIAICSGMDGLD